jgi:hypothetical protein
MSFSGKPTVENIRIYIKEQLDGKHVPRRETVKKWLSDGEEKVKAHIEGHISYWKTHSPSSPTPKQILNTLAKLIQDKLKK